jgi:hypothetical protein
VTTERPKQCLLCVTEIKTVSVYSRDGDTWESRISCDCTTGESGFGLTQEQSVNIAWDYWSYRMSRKALIEAARVSREQQE